MVLYWLREPATLSGWGWVITMSRVVERERKIPKLIILGIKKGISQQIPMKFKGSLGNILKTYILINRKS
jgi:hypothetical protein